MKKKAFIYYILKRKSPVRYKNPLYITIYKKSPKDENEFYTLRDLLNYYVE